jgi:branched-subunit amino acid transport protein AzlD
MLGPVPTHSQPNIGSAVLAEIVGTIALYFAFRGRFRPQSLRLLGSFIFAGIGGLLVWVGFQEVHLVNEDYTLATITLSVTGVALLVITLVQWGKFRGWRSWPTTSASIEITDVREIRTRSSHFFETTLSYCYKVNDEYYSGFYKREFFDETAAWEYANNAKGRSVIARFNPLKPGRSKLNDEELDLAIRG